MGKPMGRKREHQTEQEISEHCCSVPWPLHWAAERNVRPQGIWHQEKLTDIGWQVSVTNVPALLYLSVLCLSRQGSLLLCPSPSSCLISSYPRCHSRQRWPRDMALFLFHTRVEGVCIISELLAGAFWIRNAPIGLCVEHLLSIWWCSLGRL